MLCEACFIVDVRGDQVEAVLLCQQPQQDDHRPAATLAYPIINHLAGKRQHLQAQDSASQRAGCLFHHKQLCDVCLLRQP